MDPEEVISQMEKFKTAAQNHQSYSHRLANGSIRDVDLNKLMHDLHAFS